MKNYPLLDVRLSTPTLELRSATDELLDQLADVVHAGKTFSWLSVDQRGHGLGHEMRAAILHLAFDGLGAKEASSDAFVDNHGSNAISRGLGYEPNGSEWATRQGKPAPAQPVATQPRRLGTAPQGRHPAPQHRGLSRPPALVLTSSDGGGDLHRECPQFGMRVIPRPPPL